MNYANKHTSYLLSSGPNSDGYINFYNIGMITDVSALDQYIHMRVWDGYSVTADCTTAENAKHNLPLILDALSTSYHEDAVWQGIVKLNEIPGIKGVDGVLTDDYNSTLPIETQGGGGGIIIIGPLK